MKKLLLSMLACIMGSVCSQATTVYFENTLGWDPVYAYAWTPNNASWPGVALNSNNIVTVKNASTGGTVQLYAYTIPNSQPNIIFNNGNGKPQTKDLAATDGAVYNGDNVSSATVMGTVTGSGSDLTYTPSGYVAKNYDWYLCGAVNGWAQLDGDYGFEQDASNSNLYTLQLTGDLPSQFKIISKSVQWYGSSQKVDVSGATVNSTISISTSGGDIAFNDINTAIKDAKLTLNTSNMQLTITGSTGVAQNELYLLGEINSWSAQDQYKFETSDYNTYTLTLDSFPNGSDFKVGSSDWVVSLTANTKIMQNGTYPLESGGENNNMALGVTITDVTFTVDLSAMTLKIEGTEQGEVVIDYTSWYVNVLGDFNGWVDNGVNPNAEGISETKNLAIGTQGFKVKTWYSEGPSDGTYYISDGNAIPTGQWVKLYEDIYSGDPVQIEGATEGAMYDVQYNCATNEVFVTKSTVDPTGWYLVGSIKDNLWNTTEPLELNDEGDGIYAIYNVSIVQSPNDQGTYAISDPGYFTLTTIKGDWSVVNNGFRYGPGADGDAAESENEYFETKEASWSIVPGVYDITVDTDSGIVAVDAVVPSTLYVIGSINGEPLGLTNLAEMTKKDFSFTLENVAINKNAGEDTGRVYFCEQKGSSYTELGAIYGAVTNGQEATAGTATNAYFNSDNTFALAPGYYDITVNFGFDTPQVTFTAAQPVSELTINLDVAGYEQSGSVSGDKISLESETGKAAIQVNLPEGATLYYINTPATNGVALQSTDGYTEAENNTIELEGSGTLTLMSVTGDGDNAVESEPVTYDYEVVNSSTVLVEGIAVDEAEAEYYNLQGVKVANPAEGEIYIKVVNGNAVKVVK